MAWTAGDQSCRYQHGEAGITQHMPEIWQKFGQLFLQRGKWREANIAYGLG